MKGRLDNAAENSNIRGTVRGRSSMVERQLPKLHTRVRFPSPAPVSRSPSLHLPSPLERRGYFIAARRAEDDLVGVAGVAPLGVELVGQVLDAEGDAGLVDAVENR